MFLKSTNSGSKSSSTPKATTAKAAPASRRIVPSVVSVDMNILGNIISEGSIDFDGTIDGNIRCGTLVLRQSGRVNGEIHADTVQVYGKVKGLIKAKSVHLFSSCSVEGIIMHETIAIEDGATIDGKFKRSNKSAAPSLPLPQQFAMMDEQTAGEESDSSSFEPPKLLENIRLIAG